MSLFKISFGVSLLVHGLVLGFAVLLGKFERVPAVVVVRDATVLELIAAPASSPEQSAVKPIAPIPMPTQPQQEVIPEKIPEPIKSEDSFIPIPVQPVAELPLIARATIPTPAPVSEPAPTTIQGDNSSPLLGRDFTSAIGNPAAKAKPDYLKNPEPEYPLAARRRRQSGSVVLNVTVSGSGRATEISIKTSSGYDLLDQAALKAVKAWEFKPARIGAVGMESKIEVPIRFKLSD